MTVTIRPDTVLTGKFRMESDTPGALWILVMSAERALQQEWATTNDVAQGNTKGSFSLVRLPGRYLLAAVPQTTFRFNPWVEARKNIRRFASGGAAVTVKEREVTTVTLTSR